MRDHHRYIVGFPGETEADFEATLGYVETGVFANAFMFIYSIRRGTPAAKWEQVPRDIALARFTRLVDAQNRTTRAYHDRKVGRVVRALIAGDSKKDASRLTAKTPDNVTIVAPKPPDYPLERRPQTHPYARTPWLDVAIENAHVWGCFGTVVARAERFDDAGESRAADDRSDGAGAANAAPVTRGQVFADARAVLRNEGQHPEAILLSRVGDFYEAYGEDAEAVAHALQIALTTKEAGSGQRVAMAGVPTTPWTAISRSWCSSHSSSL